MTTTTTTTTDRRARRAALAAMGAAVGAVRDAADAMAWHVCPSCGADYRDDADAVSVCDACDDDADRDADAWRADALPMTDDDAADHAAALAWCARHDRGAATLPAVLAMLAALALVLALALAATIATDDATTAPTTTTAPRAGVCDDHGAAVCGAVGVTLTPDATRAVVTDARGLVTDGAPVTYHTTTDETGSAPAVVDYLPRCAVVPVVDATPDDGARVGVRVVGVAVGATTPDAVREYVTAAAVIGAAHDDGARCVVAVVPVALY